MHILELEARTPEWYKIRQDSWSASIAAVLVAKPNAMLLKSMAAKKGIDLDIEPLLDVGLDDFFENTLWTEWAGRQGIIPSFKGNDATNRGERNEDFVLDYFEGAELLTVKREVTAQLSKDHWLMASFDALIPPEEVPGDNAPFGIPVEAKCPAFGSRKKLWEAKKSKRLAVMGLPYYWCQVQHQIMVADAPYGWFVAIGVDEKSGEKSVQFPIMEKVPRDDRFLTAYRAAAEFYFTECIYNFEEPPKLESDEKLVAKLKLEADLRVAVKNSDAETLAECYENALAQLEEAKEHFKTVEASIVKLATLQRKDADADAEEVEIADGQLVVTFGKSKTISWQKVMDKIKGYVPSDELAEHVAKFTTERKSVKIKESI